MIEKNANQTVIAREQSDRSNLRSEIASTANGMRLAMTVFGYLIAVSFLFPATSFAFNLPPQAEKLKRGVFNVASAGAEIPKHMILEAMNAQPEWCASLRGVFYGSFKGAGKGIVRILSGAYDVLTFPINYPDNFSSFVGDSFSFTDKSGL